MSEGSYVLRFSTRGCSLEGRPQARHIDSASMILLKRGEKLTTKEERRETYFMMFLRKKQVLSARKHEPAKLSIVNMRDIEWFRPPGFPLVEESFYGSFHGNYKLTARLLLINLGSKADRSMVLLNTDLTVEDLNPDVQYSGHESNLKVHRAIMDSATLRRFDGTIVSEQLVDRSLADELSGPEEVVLFIQRVKHKIVLEQISFVRSLFM